MAVLAKNPPPADPYSDMECDERFLMMLGKFSRAQWAQAASENGIGIGDMTFEQREIYAGLWGEEGASVNTYRRLTRKEGQKYRETVAVKDEKFGAGEVRFRFSRRVSFTFEDTAKKQKHSTGTFVYDKPTPVEPDGSTLVQYFSQPSGYRRFAEDDAAKAYGVALVRSVPNTLKPGDLGLDSPALAGSVMLDGSQKNVGDLLAAVSKATRIELRADRRLASLSVLMKTTPGGQSVKSGDLLKLICRSVTGTFRYLPGANASDRGAICSPTTAKAWERALPASKNGRKTPTTSGKKLPATRPMRAPKTNHWTCWASCPATNTPCLPKSRKPGTMCGGGADVTTRGQKYRRQNYRPNCAKKWTNS